MDHTGIEVENDKLAAEHAIRALPDMAYEELPDGPERDMWVRIRDAAGDQIYIADLKFKETWLRRRKR